MPGTEQNVDVLRHVLDQWKAGIDAHQPQRVADVFTEDAIFQGLRPYSVNRQGVYDYYDSQPHGLTVEYRINETRRLAENVVLGYLRADFTLPDGTLIALNLSVVMTRGQHGWQIAFYQVSALPQ
ncbi:MAG: SgcJ/EcaC family oxidoreductase [Mycobacterium sp.]|nr:SgcJ/EcaC family oxidoreductase [Mycobacterium sp.]